MADKFIRVGKVSKIDYEHGMISVTYPDLDDAVTMLLSTVSFNDEYKMPRIGDEVLTLHLPSGQARGLVLGHYWNLSNTPPEYHEKEPFYRKEFSTEYGEAYARYRDNEAELLFFAPEIRLAIDGGSITVSDIISRLSSLESRVAALEGGE